jgi:hypothetical protein
MKKITIAFFASVGILTSGFSQATYNNLAIPSNDGATSAFRGPNGTSSYASQRSVMFIHEWEMLPMNSSSITSIKFQYSAGTGAAAVPGNITLYLENTTDQDYNKPNSFSAITGTMSTAYVGAFNVPGGTGASQVTLNLTTPFIYNGGGLYVAWDYTSSGPFATNPATITSNSTTDWIRYNNSAGAAVNTFTSGAIFRPSLLFTAVNTATNEIEVVRVVTPGKVSKLASGTQSVYVTIVNSSIAAKNNIAVGLNATGANPYSNTITVATLAAGAMTTIPFTAYPVTSSGLSTLIASTAVDQILTNNAKAVSQSAGCNIISIPQPTIPTANFLTLAVGNNVITTFSHVTGSTSSSITAVNVVIPSFVTANSGAIVYPVVLNASGAIVAVGNNLTIAGANMDVNQPLTFPNPVNLFPNTSYFFGVGTTGAGYFPVACIPGLTSVNSLTTQGYYQMANGGGVPTNVKYGHLALEANLIFPSTSVNISATQTISCKNAPAVPVTLTANGMGSYQWSTGGTSSAITVTPSATTTYTVGGTDPGSQCTGSASITYSVVNVSITATPLATVVCKGKAVKFTAAGATSYTWSSVPTNTAAVTLTLNTVGTNTYSVYGAEPTLGCRSNTVVLTATVNACTGISVNSANSGDISIFPNPASAGKSEIRGLSGLNTITIYNLLGQVILTEQTENENFTLDFTNQANGTYLVKILDANNESRIIKVVNQN